MPSKFALFDQGMSQDQGQVSPSVDLPQSGDKSVSKFDLFDQGMGQTEQPTQTTQLSGGDNPQEEETINIFGSPYLWVSKAKNRAESIDRSINVVNKAAKSREGQAGAEMTGNAVLAGAAGLAGGLVDTLTLPYNLPTGLANLQKEVGDRKASLGLHGGELGKDEKMLLIDKEHKSFKGAESGIEGLKEKGFGRDAQRLESFLKENGEIKSPPRLPMIPSLTHFFSDLLGVRETMKEQKTGREIPVPGVKSAKMAGELISGGLGKKGLEKFVKNPSEATDFLKSYLKVTSSTDPKILATVGTMGIAEDIAKIAGLDDLSSFGVGIAGAMVTDFAARKGINTFQAYNQLKNEPEEVLYKLFRDSIEKNIGKSETLGKLDEIVKKHGGNLNLMLTTDSMLMTGIKNIIKYFGSSNKIMESGAIKHESEIKNAFNRVKDERINDMLPASASSVKPQDIDISKTSSYINSNVPQDVFSSVQGSKKQVYRVGENIRKTAEKNKLSQDQEALSAYKTKESEYKEALKNVDEEYKETLKLLEKEKDTAITNEISEDVLGIYGHLADGISSQEVSEGAISAFLKEKDARKLKKNQLYNEIDYKGVQGKPEEALSYLEQQAKSLTNTLHHSEDEKGVLKHINNVLESLGVKISEKELESYKGQIKTFGGAELDLPSELLLKVIKQAKGSDLKDITAEKLANSIRSVHGIAYKNNDELRGVKSFYGGLKGAYEKQLESMLKTAGNVKALKQRQKANKYFAEEIAGKNYSTVGKGIVKGDLPKSPLSYMNSVEGVKLVQSTLGNSERSKAAFERLRESKIKEIFVDKVTNPDGTINVKKFQNLFSKKDSTQDVLRYLMGSQRFNSFKHQALTVEKHQEELFNASKKALEMDYQKRKTNIEKLSQQKYKEYEQSLKSSKSTLSLDQIAEHRIGILTALDNPSELDTISKRLYQEMLKSTESDIQKAFGKDKEAYKNFKLREQETLLQARQDAYSEYFGKGIVNPKTNRVKYNELSGLLNDEPTRAYLENIAGKENIKKLDELAEWSQSVGKKLNQHVNPSQSTTLKTAIDWMKWIVKGASSLITYKVLGGDSIGNTIAGIAGGLTVGTYGYKITSHLSDGYAKMISDPKFYELALAAKNNPSPTKVDRFKAYVEERTGMGIHDLVDLIKTSTNAQDEQ